MPARFFTVLTVALLLAGAGRAGETTVETLTVGKEERSFRLHLPDGFAGPLPLVISFHGFKSNAEQEEGLTGFSELADREGFIVVYPEGRKGKWRFMGRMPEDVDFTLALIEAVAAKAPVDRDRIYANGISNGAEMAWRLACDRPGIFAAFGFVSGAYGRICGGLWPPPAILFHGTADRLLSYGGRGPFMPVRDFAQGWAEAHAGCETHPQGEVIYRQGDATGERWACATGGEAVLYTLDGKGHSWPGSNMPARITSQDVDATAVTWAFFKAHRRR